MNGDRTRPASVRRRSPAARHRAGSRSLTLGRLFGIEIGLDPSWFIAFLLIAWSLVGHYYLVNEVWTGGERLALALASSLLFFTSVLAASNLIPGFPLDGVRGLRSVIWAASGNVARATRVTGAIGQGVALSFIAFGVWQVFSGAWLSGLWVAFVGWFLFSAAAQSVRQTSLESLLDWRTVAEAMLPDRPRVPPEQSLELFVQNTLLPSARRCFPVSTPGSDALLGRLTPHEVRTIPRERSSFTKASEAMIPADALVATLPDEPLTDALDRMTETEVNQLPVLDDGRFIGMFTREHPLNLLQTLSDLNSLPSAPTRSIRGGT
jgi:CBS domain-containing protein